VRFDQQAKEGKKSFFVFIVFKSKNDEYHQKTMTGQNGVVTRFLSSLLGKSTLIGSVDSEERIFVLRKHWIWSQKIIISARVTSGVKCKGGDVRMGLI